ncbi:hypothetical protein WJX81_003833 [Elliptochloris bilobata]|uniref:Uncharacterized protein n=1 Tax=Elliptochloris bilobata TaxID=381761 RepID=A0AAW1RAI7_9CHLO
MADADAELDAVKSAPVVRWEGGHDGAAAVDGIAHGPGSIPPDERANRPLASGARPYRPADYAAAQLLVESSAFVPAPCRWSPAWYLEPGFERLDRAEAAAAVAERRAAAAEARLAAADARARELALALAAKDTELAVLHRAADEEPSDNPKRDTAEAEALRARMAGLEAAADGTRERCRELQAELLRQGKRAEALEAGAAAAEATAARLRRERAEAEAACAAASGATGAARDALAAAEAAAHGAERRAAAAQAAAERAGGEARLLRRQLAAAGQDADRLAQRLLTASAELAEERAARRELERALARQALEDALLRLHVERQALAAEAARFQGQGAGRTRQELKRRQYVEARLDALGREISHLRLELKRCC